MNALAVSHEPVEIRELNGGIQAVFRFPNGFGASVVQSPMSYGGPDGLWELAVLKWDGAESALTYSTDITDDVIGHLSPPEVEDLLSRIRSLDADGHELAHEEPRNVLEGEIV